MRNLTREDEIEALARQLFVNASDGEQCASLPMAFSAAEAFFEHVHNRRSTLPPSPNPPATAIPDKREVLRVEVNAPDGSILKFPDDVELISYESRPGGNDRVTIEIEGCTLTVLLPVQAAPAPALPTDRMGWLELWLRCCHALGLHTAAYTNGTTRMLISTTSLGWPIVSVEELTRLQSLAAELLASDAKDVRDGI